MTQLLVVILIMGTALLMGFFIFVFTGIQDAGKHAENQLSYC